MNHLLFLITLPLLLAFTFSPMSQSIDLSDSKRGAQFLIENDGATSMAVVLSVKERQMNQEGVETLSDTDELMIFPPQVIIPAKDKRTIRVNFKSDVKLEKEKNFRVIAEQLPLKVDEKIKDQTGIRMLMKYVAALYATPAGAKPDVQIESYTSDGETLTINLHNKGTKHQLMTNPVLKYRSGDTVGELKLEDLSGLAGENVLSGQQRIFRIKTTKRIPEKAKVELRVND